MGKLNLGGILDAVSSTLGILSGTGVGSPHFQTIVSRLQTLVNAANGVGAIHNVGDVLHDLFLVLEALSSGGLISSDDPNVKEALILLATLAEEHASA